MAWDSDLGTLADLVGACAEASDRTADVVRVDRLVIELPIEAQSYVDEFDTVRLGVAPPRQAYETTVMPALHRIRVTVVVTP